MLRKVNLAHILLLVGVTISLILPAHALRVYTLYDHGNGGEKNQTTGILDALQTLSRDPFTHESFNTKTISSSTIKNQVTHSLSQEPVIVIGIGEGGINGVQDLPFRKPGLTVCLASHMAFPKYAGLEGKVDVLAIPTHATSEKLRRAWKGHLLETIGVAHNRTAGAVDQVYQDHKSTLPQGCTAYLGVVLGGDIPLPAPSKKVRHFPKKQAKKLAAYVAKQAKHACILVLNGPRTGKYGPDHTEDMTVHREGKSDPVTEYFMSCLKKHGVSAHLFDFQHGSKLPYNTFELVLGALRANQGTLLVGGDSTSMVSEARDLLPPEKVIVYDNEAMDTVHHAHVASEHKAGRVAVLKRYRALKAPSKALPTLPQSAAAMIAEKVWAVHQSQK